MNLKEYINDKREAVDSFFHGYFKEPGKPPVLQQAMLYSLFAGGKRIRPILLWLLTRPAAGILQKLSPMRLHSN